MTDPNYAEIIRVQSQAFPPPQGCTVLAAAEDGSIFAFCDDDTWLAHGPDAGQDVWEDFTGPIPPSWQHRVEAMNADS